MHTTQVGERRPVTLTSELARLADVVHAANQQANRAESISGSLTGRFPVPTGNDEPSQEGYFFTLRGLIDALQQAQNRMSFALGRIDESLTDEVPAQSKYAEATGPADYPSTAKYRGL